jgi:tetratricopeptide (TPR) repeat protein|tara:strand:- start:1211 stop:1897 length:687 start_codon:yes stop_codon:yes gene_type:complete
MANKNTEHEEEIIVDVVESYSKTQRYLEENQRPLTIIGVILVAVIGGFIGFNNLYLAPLEAEAKEQMWRAEQYFENDSLELAIYGDGNYFGFEQIIESYGLTESANLAHYYLGLIHYKQGDYEIAIQHLEDFSSDDIMVGSVAKGVLGDCFIGMDDMDHAVDYYVKAAKDNKNSFTTPVYLLKAGKVYEQMGEYKKALKAYEEIRKVYPFSQEGRSIKKYIARAEGKM